jgi:riboflavin biosynthesis pyrimidine reductase
LGNGGCRRSPSLLLSIKTRHQQQEIEMGNQPSSPAIQRVKRAISLQKPQVKAVVVDGGLTVTNSLLYENDYDKLLVAKGSQILIY